MTRSDSYTVQVLALALIFSLVIGPQLAQAQSSTVPAQPPSDQPNSPQEQNRGIVDPSKGPLKPVSPSETAPGSAGASAQDEAGSSSSSAAPNAPTPQNNVDHPLGAAVGQAGKTAGGPASSPAGMAIAPAKQRQTRSLLIKIGAVAAAGVALGTVVALTRGTPSNPPGAK